MLEKYEEFLKIDMSYSPNTIIKYLENIKLFLNYLAKIDLDLLDVEYEDLSYYLLYLKKEKNLKAASRNNHISALRSFFLFLYRNKYLDSNPSSLLENPKLEKKLPIYLTPKEMEDLIDSVNLDKAHGFRNLLIIEILYSSGVRVSELLGITLNDIDYQKKTIKILGKGNKERIVLINDTVLYYLEKYLTKERNKLDFKTNYLFINNKGIVLSRIDVYNIISKCALEAGIEKKVSPHTLRHTFATHLVNNNANVLVVKKLLGHEKISTTEKYTHLGNKELRNKYDEFMKRGKKDEI